VLPGGMGRLSLAIIAVLLVGCDEEDPATSEHCVMTRMRAIEIAHNHDELVRLGLHSTAATSRLVLAKLQNENWQCFR
jgi:hypothetical protein